MAACTHQVNGEEGETTLYHLAVQPNFTYCCTADGEPDVDWDGDVEASVDAEADADADGDGDAGVDAGVGAVASGVSR